MSSVKQEGNIYNDYGAIDDDDDLAQYYVQPQARSQSRSHFGKQSSYSSNAASIDQMYMEMDMSTLDENHEFRIKDELNERMYSNEFDIDIAKQPRDIYKANHIELGSKPSDNLKCIWFSLILIMIFVFASMTCIDEYIISIYGNSSQSGLYYWSFGWSGSKFYSLDTLLTEEEIELKYTKQYAVDAGRFFIISCMIIFICLILVMIILCSRCTNQVYLYILCCNIRIPQTPSLYILFSIIKHYSRISIYLYLFVILYGMLEMNYYNASSICQILGGACSNFAIPHYGAASLFLIGLIINCFITKRILFLDKPFHQKTIQYYYPDHVRKLNSRNSTPKLSYLKQSLHSIRIILISASVLMIAFHEVGFILIANNNNNNNTTFSLFFQFRGLINDKGINYNNISQADNFVMICWIYWHLLLPFVFIFNFMTLFYLYWVIIKFKSIAVCKFFIILLMFIELLLFIIINGLYYYLFYVFWNDYLKDEYSYSWWSPDWGLLIVILICYYQLKLILSTYKSM